MPRNEWFHIAEVMQQREHQLINDLLEIIEETRYKGLWNQTYEDLIHCVNYHLRTTGRQEDTKPQIKELSEVDSDTRSKLLKLLGASERQETAFSQPIEVRQVKLTKAGVPRKQRSDKGKPRGKRGSK